MSASERIDIAVPAMARLGQAPTWDSALDSLLWVDALSNTVHRYVPGDKNHTMETPQQVSAAKPRSRGGLLLHMTEGLALYEANGQHRTWLVYWNRDGFVGAETAVDSTGRLWAATRRPDERDDGWLARVEPHGAARVVLPGIAGGNGLAWNPESTRMYFSDSATGQVDVLDFDPACGAATGRRVFCSLDDTDGQPAGLCVDADGCVWVTVRGAGQVRRYSPDGAWDRTVGLPVERPTGCCFGGTDLTDLFVTSARNGVTEPGDVDGSLLVLPELGTGLRAHAFAG
ncbi:SMP-30/gluconolactonase/LRE family protein [Parasphingorhabdus pacifica]